MQPNPKVVPPGAGKALHVLGDVVTSLVVGADTAGPTPCSSRPPNQGRATAAPAQPGGRGLLRAGGRADLPGRAGHLRFRAEGHPPYLQMRGHPARQDSGDYLASRVRGVL
jgi:hypothetical protein